MKIFQHEYNRNQAFSLFQHLWRNLNKTSFRFFSIFIGLILLISIVGCNKYQYVTVEGDVVIESNMALTYLSDSVIINYGIADKNGMLQIEIYNVSPTPIFIDWTKSVLLFDENRYVFYQTDSTIFALKQNLLNAPDSIKFYNGQLIDEQNLTIEQISTLASGEKLKVSPILLKNRLFELEQNSYFMKVPLNNTGKKAKEFNFSYENSPFKFRSYFTLASDKKIEKQMLIDNNFWVSQILESRTKPSAYTYRKRNQYYISKINWN